MRRSPQHSAAARTYRGDTIVCSNVCVCGFVSVVCVSDDDMLTPTGYPPPIGTFFLIAQQRASMEGIA